MSKVMLPRLKNEASFTGRIMILGEVVNEHQATKLPISNISRHLYHLFSYSLFPCYSIFSHAWLHIPTDPASPRRHFQLCSVLSCSVVGELLAPSTRLMPHTFDPREQPSICFSPTFASSRRHTIDFGGNFREHSSNGRWVTRRC